MNKRTRFLQQKLIAAFVDDFLISKTGKECMNDIIEDINYSMRESTASLHGGGLKPPTVAEARREALEQLESESFDFGAVDDFVADLQFSLENALRDALKVYLKESVFPTEIFVYKHPRCQVVHCAAATKGEALRNLRALK
jgi:hypothetical protein